MQHPPPRRLSQPMGLYARSLPSAWNSRHGRSGSHQAALLPEPHQHQPDADRAGGTGDRFRTSPFAPINAITVNLEHRAVAEQLGVPFVLYKANEPPKAIVAALELLLKAG